MTKAYGRFLCDGQRGGKGGTSDIISVVVQESHETGRRHGRDETGNNIP